MSEPKLSDLLLKASGEPTQPAPKLQVLTSKQSQSIVRNPRAEAPQGQCPSCGYRADLSDFEVDSDESGDNDDTDKELWETADEAGETALAQRLLKQAGLANKQQDTKAEPKKLSREQVQNILNTAVANLRNPRS